MSTGLKSKTNSAFTMLELMLAVSIMAVVATVTYASFSAVTLAWKKGTRLSDNMSHGDFVIEQLAMGLRSAYYPDKPGSSLYGFWLDDEGSGAGASDRISWVKVGSSLVGSEWQSAGAPHRVRFFTGDSYSAGGAQVTMWPLLGLPDDFDPDELEPTLLSSRVVGFDCRCANEFLDDSEPDWLDEWKETNRIPRLVEITLYLEPLDDGDEPVEVKRLIQIPTAPLSW